MILTTVFLSKLGSSKVSSDMSNILGLIYELAVRSGVTRVRNTIRLESFLGYEEEKEVKKRQKNESILEELNSVIFCTEYQYACYFCCLFVCVERPALARAVQF